jgi:hypothetical protein
MSVMPASSIPSVPVWTGSASSVKAQFVGFAVAMVGVAAFLI